MKKLAFLIVAFLFVSCAENLNQDYRNLNDKINIYLTESEADLFHSAQVTLDSFVLENSPWVKSSNIEFYDWSAHAFYLNKEIEKEKYSGRNFMVTSGEKRLFAGVFWPMYMSSIPMIPAIMPEDDWFSPKDVIRFNSFGWQFAETLNDNNDFKSELIDAGLLREGIDVEITALKRKSTTTLEYTYRVTNLDTENIYILDPDKMGASRFHYYTNGIRITKNDNYYYPYNFETTASNAIASDWYYKLHPGKSISRTVQMEGYQSLPSGEVEASFNFPGANLKQTGSWKKSDGRIWIGNHLTTTDITIE